jgi:hypothetical protein
LALGLPETVLVVAGGMDQGAGAVGVGNLGQGVVSESTGGALTLQATVARHGADPTGQTPVYVHSAPDRYLYCPVCPTGGMALTWFRDQFGAEELDQAARELADAIAGDDDAADSFGEATGAETTTEGDGNGHPHEAPDLEALVPREVAGTRMQVTSARVSDWQSSLLRKAVENVGADPLDAYVALGLGGTGEDTLAVTIYAIPGVPQDRLEAEFAREEYLAEGQHWEQRDVDGKTVWWSAAARSSLTTVAPSPARL